MKNIKSFSMPSLHFLPLLTTILFLIFYYIPFSFGIDNSIRPLLALCSCFFWLTHRLDIFGVASVLIISFLSDIISSAPIGSDVLMYFCLYFLINRFERFFYNKGFVTYWYGFILFSFVAMFLKWFVLSMYYSKFLPFDVLFFSYLITVICYPFVSIVNAIIQNYVSVADE